VLVFVLVVVGNLGEPRLIEAQVRLDHLHGQAPQPLVKRDVLIDFLSDLSEKGVKEISTDLRKLLADVFALYVKTKNFHWHMTGPNFRDYHRLLDDHGEQIFAMSDVVAERIRKLGDVALRSIGDIARHQRVDDNDTPSLTPEAMLTDLLANNQELIQYLRATHDVCDQHNDVATASLIVNWIDETENRAWFLYEILHHA
jgi:starvation-inducible DNA-binding protein